MQEHQGGAVFEPRQGATGYDPVRQAMRRPYRTRDGFLCFLPYVDAHWNRFFEVIGRPDLPPILASRPTRGGRRISGGCGTNWHN
jgi:crotonobetainyl-CoA:carnitine CoA-transferase CaiB-like acyl-CoA transferase